MQPRAKFYSLVLFPVMLILSAHSGGYIAVNCEAVCMTMPVTFRGESQSANPQIVLRHTLMDDEVSWITFSPDGQTLAAGNKLFDTKSGQVKARLASKDRDFGAVFFSPDGKLLAVRASGHQVKLWDVETGQLKRILAGHKGSIWEVEFSPDGKQLLTSSADGTAKLWDVETGQLKATIREHEGFLLKGSFIKASFNPDGGNFITSSADDKHPRLWDAKTGEMRAVLRGHTKNVLDHAFSPDGRLVATASFDNTVKLWDARSGTLRATLDGCYAYYIKFSPNSQLVAAACSDGAARLWGAGGSLIRTLKMTNKRATTVNFSPDGQTLAVCHPDIDKCGLWDVSTGQLLTTVAADDGYRVGFSPNGRLLVTMNDKDKIIVWNARSGESIKLLDGAKWPAFFNSDGKILATLGRGNIVLLWEVISP